MHASLATPKALQRTLWSVDRDGVLVGHHYASISKLLLPCLRHFNRDKTLYSSLALQRSSPTAFERSSSLVL